VSSAAASNSQLIASNNSARGQLDPTDVRRKYIMTGSTWTIGGVGFNGNFSVPGNTAAAFGRGVGTNQMAHTTMETFQQGTPPTSFDSFSNNCFSCHGTNTSSVSHIYTTPGSAPRGLKPLF
jgi:cytochrome c1